MSSAKAKTIKLLLEDGTLNGVLTIEDTLWNTGEMYSAPRDAVDELLKLDVCDKYGIYMLLSEDMVYVGQAGDLSKRIKQHLAGKRWWKRVILITTKDDSFTHTDIDYLESYFIDLAKKNNKLDCDNKQRGSKVKVSRFDKVQLDQYIEEAMFLLELIGVKVFSPKQNKSIPVIESMKTESSKTYTIEKKNQAIRYLVEKGIKINHRDCTYATLQKTKKEFWANPNRELLNKNWSIILNNTQTRELIYLLVPAETYSFVDGRKKGCFALRKDRKTTLDVNILQDSYIDIYSNIDMSVFIKGKYTY